MFSERLAAVVMVGALALTACSDSLSLGPGNASEDDREEILQLLEESGFFADDFGLEGVTASTSKVSGALGAYALAAGVEAAAGVAPRIWGRRRGRPIRRVITVDVDRDAGTATVSKELAFDGRFLLDITDDGQVNPTGKPLQETLLLSARFRRVARNSADQQGRRWRLLGVSPAQWVMTDVEKQTVNIMRVEVWVNEQLVLAITDPSELVDVADRVPRLHREDHVLVRAWVENGVDNGNDPDTFVFLHLFHANADIRAWIRRPMEMVQGDDGVHYERSWTARHIGRSRIAVDAIDAETFTTESEDDYRANIWGIPYRILTSGSSGEG